VLICRRNESSLFVGGQPFLILPYSNCHPCHFSSGVVNVNGEYVIVENILVHSVNWIRENFFIPYSKEKHRVEKFFSGNSAKNPYLPSLKEKIKKAMENPFQISLVSVSKEKDSTAGGGGQTSNPNPDEVNFEPVVENVDMSDDNVKNQKNIDVENNNFIGSSASYPLYFKRTNCLLKENNIATPIVFFRSEFTVPVFLSFFVLFVFACMVIIMVLYVLLLELFVDRIGVVERRGSSFNSLFDFNGRSTPLSYSSSLSLPQSSSSGLTDVSGNSYNNTNATLLKLGQTVETIDANATGTKVSPFRLILNFFNGPHYMAFAVLLTFTLVCWPLTM
jgi:hypothetical protein